MFFNPISILHKIEETFKPILNVEPTNECMNILLLPNVVFQLWQNVLLEWEGCNILDGFGHVLTCPPKSIRKSTFSCLTSLKVKQFKKLARGLLSKAIKFRKCLVKGKRLNLKSMYEFTRLLKWKAMIHYEIMIHFRHPKLIASN
jgi:hypothetical protein